jgi:hypothetical protein
MLQNLGEEVQERDVAAILGAVDESNSGAISLHDFIRILGKDEKTDSDPIDDVFAYMDKDNNGEIEYNELFDFLEAFGMEPQGEEVSLLFEQLDADKNGKISKADWIKAVSLTT